MKKSTAILCVRSLSLSGTTKRPEEFRNQLMETDKFSTVKIELWGNRVPLNTQVDYGQNLLDRYREFVRWAAENGYSLCSFDKRSVGSFISESKIDVLIPPQICLAEYEGNSLQYLTPCRDGDTLISVSDRVKSIVREDPKPLRKEHSIE